jgi:hypothetical protein
MYILFSTSHQCFVVFVVLLAFFFSSPLLVWLIFHLTLLILFFFFCRTKVTLQNCRLIKNKKSGVFCYGSGTCDVLGNDTAIERNDDVDLLVSGGIINVHVMELTCGRRVENGGTIM